MKHYILVIADWNQQDLELVIELVEEIFWVKVVQMLE